MCVTEIWEVASTFLGKRDPALNPVSSVSHIISWNKWERECCSSAPAFREDRTPVVNKKPFNLNPVAS